MSAINCTTYLLSRGTENWNLPRKLWLKLTEVIHTVLEIGTMCREVRCLGHFPWLPQGWTENWINLLDWGAAGRPFAIRLCAWGCRLGHKEKVFKCSPKDCLCGFGPSVCSLQLPHIVIDSIQSSKSSTPKSLCCFPGKILSVFFKNHLNRVYLHG